MQTTGSNKTIRSMISEIIEIEGGHVNHPKDRGGPTKYGITIKTLSAWTGKKCTADDVKSLKKATALIIYEHMYFNEPKINKLPAQIQPIVLDMAVNHGPEKAIKLLQEVLLAHGKNVGKVDGIIGFLTLEAAQCAFNLLGNDLINTIITRRINYYKSIVENDRSQADFLNGWITRAESFRVAIA